MGKVKFLFERGEVTVDHLGQSVGLFLATYSVGGSAGETAALRIQGAVGSINSGLSDINIGTLPGTVGEVHFDTPQVLNIFGAIRVGGAGTGRLFVSNGSRLKWPSAGFLRIEIALGSSAIFRDASASPGTADLVIDGTLSAENGVRMGTNVGRASGDIHIRGAGSQLTGIWELTSTASMEFSDGASGQLQKVSRGALSVLSGSQVAIDGFLKTLDGSVLYVDGIGSRIEATRTSITVDATITNGGFASFDTFETGTLVASGVDSTVSIGNCIYGSTVSVLDGARLIRDSEMFIGYGLLPTQVTIGPSGGVEMPALTIIENGGVTLESDSTASLGIVGLGGAGIFPPPVTLGGTLVIRAGANASADSVTLHELGSVTGDGLLVSDVTNETGIVDPGVGIGALTLRGAYTQQPAGGLRIEFSATTADHLTVDGLATIAGTLHLDFSAGVPPMLQAIPILSAAMLTGEFESATSVGLAPRVGVSVEYSPIGASITLHEPCFGDADGDRMRDMGDLAQILAMFGQSGSPTLLGDANGDGVVDFADITVVLGQWGEPCL